MMIIDNGLLFGHPV